MQNDALQNASKTGDASQDASMGVPPAAKPESSPMFTSVIAGNGPGYDGAQHDLFDGKTSPQATVQRAGSRNPRRSKQSPSPAGGRRPPDKKKKDTFPPPDPPFKATKTHNVDDAANVRGRSLAGQSAGSVEPKPAAHYAEIMQGDE